MFEEKEKYSKHMFTTHVDIIGIISNKQISIYWSNFRLVGWATALFGGVCEPYTPNELLCPEAEHLKFFIS